MRIVIVAVALCVFAFLLGVAGDLSNAAAPRTSGQSVTLRIPPALPMDAPRAAPLPLATASAAAAELPARAPRTVRVVETKAEIEPPPPRAGKPRAERMLMGQASKLDEDQLAKAKYRKLG